jgi:hypothetical protein
MLSRQENIIIRFNEYVLKDYVFTSCDNKWIAVLKIVNGTTHDENIDREICDYRYAEFTGTQFFVVDIVDKFDNDKRTDEVVEKYKGTYTVGQITAPDMNITYYRSPVAAFHTDLTCGNNRQWYENGRPMSKGTGPIGDYISWYENGNVWKKYRYSYDFLPRLKPRVSLIDGSRF